jgi:hypothetical protein
MCIVVNDQEECGFSEVSYWFCYRLYYW